MRRRKYKQDNKKKKNIDKQPPPPNNNNNIIEVNVKKPLFGIDRFITYVERTVIGCRSFFPFDSPQGLYTKRSFEILFIRKYFPSLEKRGNFYQHTVLITCDELSIYRIKYFFKLFLNITIEFFTNKNVKMFRIAIKTVDNFLKNYSEDSFSITYANLQERFDNLQKGYHQKTDTLEYQCQLFRLREFYLRNISGMKEYVYNRASCMLVQVESLIKNLDKKEDFFISYNNIYWLIASIKELTRALNIIESISLEELPGYISKEPHIAILNDYKNSLLKLKKSLSDIFAHFSQHAHPFCVNVLISLLESERQATLSHQQMNIRKKIVHNISTVTILSECSKSLRNKLSFNFFEKYLTIFQTLREYCTAILKLKKDQPVAYILIITILKKML